MDRLNQLEEIGRTEELQREISKKFLSPKKLIENYFIKQQIVKKNMKMKFEETKRNRIWRKIANQRKTEKPKSPEVISEFWRTMGVEEVR